MTIEIRTGENPVKPKEIKPDAPTEYQRGRERGAEARKKYSPETIKQFLGTMRNKRDLYTVGFCDGLTNVERG